MNRKYKGGGCGCGAGPLLQTGGRTMSRRRVPINAQAMPSNGQSMPSNNQAIPVGIQSMTKTGSRSAKQIMPSNGEAMSSNNQAMPRRRQPMVQPASVSAKQIKFSNGTSLEGQVANMQKNLNSITGRKTMKKQMRGGQNNNSLATLHNKVNALTNKVDVIEENIQEQNGDVNFSLFGGQRPMANTFLETNKNGGGLMENIGNFLGFNNTTAPGPMAAPRNTNVVTLQPAPVVVNSDLPDPSAVVNKPVVQTNATVQPTGGNEGSIMNSFFGGYKATKRNLKYLKNWKKGKSIGFTMRSSLKAKGLIPRANGTRRVSKKYQ